jgi:hypothetical protein
MKKNAVCKVVIKANEFSFSLFFRVEISCNLYNTYIFVFKKKEKRESRSISQVSSELLIFRCYRLKLHTKTKREFFFEKRDGLTFSTAAPSFVSRNRIK